MAQALHIRFRKKLSQLTHRLLSKLFPAKVDEKSIPKEEVKRILVVRINYRIGNILFITPLLSSYKFIYIFTECLSCSPHTLVFTGKI